MIPRATVTRRPLSLQTDEACFRIGELLANPPAAGRQDWVGQLGAAMLDQGRFHRRPLRD